VYGDLPYDQAMASATKDNRLELRLTSEQKREIEHAAAIAGRSVTEFSVPLLVEHAEQVIQQDRRLRMSQESWNAFNAILERPAQHIDALAELIRRPSVFSDQ
jgi:uncharacterized protein (DUF1778 family)